jgi:hypothetical protein
MASSASGAAAHGGRQSAATVHDVVLSWRNISITLIDRIDQFSMSEISWFHQLSRIYTQSAYRLSPMKAADRVVRAVVLAIAFAIVLAPWNWMFPLILIFFGIVGAWALLYPQGILGWGKKPHPRIDDPSLWRVLRLVGGSVLGLTLLIAAFAFRC